PISSSARRPSGPWRRWPSLSIATCCWTLCGATARSEARRTSESPGDGLADGAGEHTAESGTSDHESGRRPVVEGIAEHGADQTADGNRRQRFRDPAEGSARTPVVLGERPHAPWTSCHGI